ncbi:MAG: TldD/PmbA family protein [Actinomycetota bacterium]
MSAALLELAETIAGRASRGEQLEAYVTHSRTFEARAYAGEIDSLSSAEPRGAGVRVITGRKVGFAFTTDLSVRGLDNLVRAARDNSSYAGEDEGAGLPEAWKEPPEEVPGLLDPSQSSADPERKVAFVLELEAAAKSRDERIKAVEDAVYADSDSEVAIATSTGIAGAYRRSDAWCYVVAIVEENDDTQVGFDFGLARGIESLDAVSVAASAADRGLRVLGAAPIPSARMPIVFDPYVAGQFLGVLGGALTGDAVQKGRSLFAGRLGDRVAAEGLTLVDDGRLADAPGSSPWDDEGVPTGRTPVIEDGILRSFLYDTTSARREQRASTGNAARAGFKSVPRPSPSNLAFDSGELGADELLRQAGKALLVQDFHGVHSGANPVSGDFSVGATGLLLENGAPGRPVKEVTIAAPMLDILGGIVAVASDRRWLPFEGSFGGATTLVAEMTIAGS